MNRNNHQEVTARQTIVLAIGVILVICCSIGLAACVATWETTQAFKGTRMAKLLANSSAYVSVPKDGVYGTHVYGGSGSAVAQIILEGFLAHMARVESGIIVESFEDALAQAQSRNFLYLVFPTILAWEDRITSWLGIPDRAEIKIVIADVATGDTIDAIVIRAKSATMTFGNNVPADLLPAPIKKYVSTIF